MEKKAAKLFFRTWIGERRGNRLVFQFSRWNLFRSKYSIFRKARRSNEKDSVKEKFKENSVTFSSILIFIHKQSSKKWSRCAILINICTYIANIRILETKKKKKKRAQSDQKQTEMIFNWFFDSLGGIYPGFISLSYLKFTDQRKQIIQYRSKSIRPVTFLLSHYLFINKWSREGIIVLRNLEVWKNVFRILRKRNNTLFRNVPKERWNVWYLASRLSGCAVREQHGKLLNDKTTKSSCLVNVELRISYYLSSGPFHGIIGESCHFRRRHLSKTVPYNIISAGMQPIHRERSIVRSGTIAPFRSQSSFPGKQLVLSRLHTNQPTG